MKLLSVLPLLAVASCLPIYAVSLAQENRDKSVSSEFKERRNVN